METKIVKLPTRSLRKMEIPSGSEGTTVLIIAAVAIKDLPFDLLEWDELRKDRVTIENAETKRVREGILKTLKEQPGMMPFYHRGIELAVKETTFKKNTDGSNTLFLEFADKSAQGILDGKFTLEVLREHEKDNDEGVVVVRIFINDDANLAYDMTHYRY